MPGMFPSSGFDPYSTPEQTQYENEKADSYGAPVKSHYAQHAAQYAGEASGLAGGVMSPDKAMSSNAVNAARELGGGNAGQSAGSEIGNMAPAAAPAASATPWGAIAAAGLAYYQGVDRISKKRKIGAKDLFQIAYPTQGGMFGGAAAGALQNQTAFHTAKPGMGGGGMF